MAKYCLGNFSIQNITFDTEVRAIMTFGEMVKYARKQLSMTQTELEKRSASALRRLIDGRMGK